MGINKNTLFAVLLRVKIAEVLEKNSFGFSN